MMPARDLGTIRGDFRLNEPMSRHTSWRVGGPADRYFRPVDIDDLAMFIADVPAAEPIFWLGLGSNLLVRDGGIRGTVVATSRGLDGLQRTGDQTIRVEAGVACAKVARFSARAGLVGAEFLVGIPGTMGGALAMNAGCFGGETWRIVSSVETIDRSGQRHVRRPEDYRIGYRSVTGPADEWFVAAELKLEFGDADSASARMRALMDQRGATQPIGQANAGSVFRNPEGDHAARLIESCGLKGTCIGGACVSDKHANFIVNTGGAKAREIERLIERVTYIVRERHGVLLQPEVRIVGEAVGDEGDVHD